MLDRLLRDHDNIRALADKFESLLNQEVLADIEPVSQIRWEITKATAQHTAFEDRYVNLPLERDPTPHAAATAKRFKRELEAVQDDFEGHMERWTAAATKAQWSTYRKIALGQTRALIDRMRREESELFPLIAGCAEINGASGPGAPERNWARAAWKVQSSLDRH